MIRPPNRMAPLETHQTLTSSASQRPVPPGAEDRVEYRPAILRITGPFQTLIRVSQRRVPFFVAWDRPSLAPRGGEVVAVFSLICGTD